MSNYPEGVTDADPHFTDDAGPTCEHSAPMCEACEEEDYRASRIPCSRCGQPATWDPTYGDLCYRCCRADNE